MEDSLLMLPLQESFYDSLDMIITFLPNLVGAILLLIIGIIVGRLISSGVRHLLGLTNFNRLMDNWGITALFEHLGFQKTVSHLVGTISCWLVFLLFLISAANVLGLDVLTDALISLAYALPDILLAALIVLGGIYGAGVLRNLVTSVFDSTGLPAARTAGQMMYIVTVLVVIIMAAARLGFDTSFVASFVLILTTGVVATIALALGLGAGPAVKNLIGTYSVRHFVQIGQEVQIGDITGKVLDVTSMVIVLEVNGKKMVIPASRLNDSPTTINPPPPSS